MEVEKWLASTQWKVFNVHEAVRILHQVEYQSEDSFDKIFSANRSKAQVVAATTAAAVPCMRCNIPMKGTMADTFATIMNFYKARRPGIVTSLSVVQVMDNNTDIIHMKFEPLYLEFTWTAPRDFCLVRYWRENEDGSYVICYNTTTHEDCPMVDGYVRGELHASYVIAPPNPAAKRKAKNSTSSSARDVGLVEDEDSTECLLIFICQLDPKGWIPYSWGYKHLFLQHVMLHVIDIRDSLEDRRFLSIHFDTAEHGVHSSRAEGESKERKENKVSITNCPPWILPEDMWGEPDASLFKVRGATYNSDKVKVSSQPSLFKLLGIDLIETPDTHFNIAAHPTNRVALAKARGEDAYTLVFNICVPGPPFLSFVMYWAMDRDVINADTPFGRIAKPFFEGSNDDFRNNRFKLIPKVVDGNMVIKMAVKDTPTLLGNKLKQYYHRADHYFEIDVDIGSSSVARNVVGLALGYAKNIIVDMALCLQGNDGDELPEVIMCTCATVHVDVGHAKKLGTVVT